MPAIYQRRAPVVFLLFFAACKPPDAPTELSELSAWLFMNFEEQNEKALSVGLANLHTFFAGIDLDQGYNDLAYTLDPLTDEYTADVTHPDEDPAEQTPVGLVTASAFMPDSHAQVMLMEDQTPVEPNSPERYWREFTEPADATCFADRSCDLMRTMNDIIKENFLINIPYDMHKDFRWVPFELDGAENQAILSRSWCEEVAVGESGNNEIRQSYSVDIFLPDGAGAGMRYMALWSASVIPGFGEDAIAGSVKTGMHQMFEATETWLVDNNRR